MPETASVAIPKEAFSFLRELGANNNREWFHANKKTYEQILKTPVSLYCQALTDALSALTGDQHQFKIFRINRDIRFSKDKTPYNTHIRAAFSPLDHQPLSPAWYFSLEIDQLAFGCGNMGLDSQQLDGFRQRILSANGANLASIVAKFSGSGIRISEPDLKRVPAGFDKEHQRADLLRYKSIAAWVDIPDSLLATRGDFLDFSMDNLKRLQPLYHWLAGE